MIRVQRLLLLFAVWAFIACQGAFAQLTVVEWNFPNNPDDAVVDISTASNAGKTITTVGGTNAIVFNILGASSQCAWTDGWNAGSGVKAWQIEFNTFGLVNLEVASKQRSSPTGPRDFKIQYRIGAAGAWTDVTGATAIVVADNFTTGVVGGIALPVACENQASVYMRWIMTTNNSVGGSTVATGGTSRIDDLQITANSNDYYRTIATGIWDVTSIWESSPNNISWFPAVMPPTFYARTITVRAGHAVDIINTLKVDEVIVAVGGSLTYANGALTINDAPGVDLMIYGTFTDGHNTSVSWNAGTTWALGANGNFVKSSSGSANNWRDRYDGSISNIPVTSNWYIRKSGTSNPSVSSLLMYYPNLFIENYTGGNWNMTVGSIFTGSSSSPIILGSLNVGGGGTGTVTFTNENTNASPVTVMGDVSVRPGNTLFLSGTGFECHSNVNVSGAVTYAAANSPRWSFAGSNPQSISGAGTFNIFNFSIAKSGNNVTLSRPITIDNNLNLVNGNLLTTATNVVTLIDNATATGANNSSFVSGPVRKIGDEGFVFPVGKNNDYQSIAIGTAIATTDVFTAEYFYTDPAFVYGAALGVGLDHISKCEYWNLVQSVGASNRTVTLAFDVNSCGVNLLADLRVARYNGVLWNDQGNGGTTGTATAGTIISNSTAQPYGPFTLASATSFNPLPVELIFVDARFTKQNHVLVSWATMTEILNDYFIVERSKDGLAFEQIGLISGHGSTSIRHDYEFTDIKPIDGLSYYRLAQVDFDGTTKYTAMIPVRKVKSSQVLVYPNPASDYVSIILPDSFEGQLSIHDMQGRKIVDVLLDHSSRFMIDREIVSSGLYFLQFNNVDGTHFSEKIIVR